MVFGNAKYEIIGREFCLRNCFWEKGWLVFKFGKCETDSNLILHVIILGVLLKVLLTNIIVYIYAVKYDAWIHAKLTN